MVLNYRYLDFLIHRESAAGHAVHHELLSSGCPIHLLFLFFWRFIYAVWRLEGHRSADFGCQCTALAADVKHSISPFLSEGAAESILQYKHGNWLFSFH